MSLNVTFTVYTFHAADGACLYVGMTSNYLRRLAAHSTEKPWWRDVDHVKVEHLPTRRDAYEHERRRIEERRPLYNAPPRGQG